MSTKRRWQSCARKPSRRATSQSSGLPQDRLPGSPPFEFDVHSDVGGHKRSVPQASLFEDLPPLRVVLESEDRLEESEVDFDRAVHMDCASEPRATREDGPEHLDAVRPHPFQEPVAHDPTVRPFAGAHLRIRVARIVGMDVDVGLWVLGIVRPPFFGSRDTRIRISPSASHSHMIACMIRPFTGKAASNSRPVLIGRGTRVRTAAATINPTTRDLQAVTGLYDETHP